MAQPKKPAYPGSGSVAKQEQLKNLLMVRIPSVNLSPYTVDRLREEMLGESISLVGKSKVKDVKLEDDQYSIYVKGKKSSPYQTQTPPILATGFDSSLIMVKDLFDWDESDSYVLLNEDDESRKTPGLFLVGPQVRHEDLIFCFIHPCQPSCFHLILATSVLFCVFLSTKAFSIPNLSCITNGALNK